MIHTCHALSAIPAGSTVARVFVSSLRMTAVQCAREEMLMQMYEVSFQVHYEDLIDHGKVLVCASNNESATDMVRMLMDLPPSRTVFDCVRIKPSIFTLKRHQANKKAIGQSHNRGLSPTAKYMISIVSTVRAASETNALRKLAHSLIDRSCSDKAVLDKSIMELEISCDRQEYRPKPSAVEKQAIYKEHAFFAGGAARPR